MYGSEKKRERHILQLFDNSLQLLIAAHKDNEVKKCQPHARTHETECRNTDIEDSEKTPHHHTLSTVTTEAVRSEREAGDG